MCTCLRGVVEQTVFPGVTGAEGPGVVAGNPASCNVAYSCHEPLLTHIPSPEETVLYSRPHTHTHRKAVCF